MPMKIIAVVTAEPDLVMRLMYTVGVRECLEDSGQDFTKCTLRRIIRNYKECRLSEGFRDSWIQCEPLT